MVEVFNISLSKLLEVLVVPITVAAAVPLFNWLQRRRELYIGDQRAQDEALQAYLDQMSQLLLDKDRPLLKSKTDSKVGQDRPEHESGTESEVQTLNEIQTLARARTQTVLTRLDRTRKRSVVQFLYEAALINKNVTVLGDYPLKEADLREADLSEAHLPNANLSAARLSEANLARADLRGADLRGANLRNAILRGARLGPPPSEEDAEPDQTAPADLRMADLSYADLEGAEEWAVEQLTAARFLKGATMPNGLKYEAWLKVKESR
jgi:hypothetical protein